MTDMDFSGEPEMKDGELVQSQSQPQSQQQQPVDEDSLEYLRAKYLGISTAGYGASGAEKEKNGNGETVESDVSRDDSDDIEALRRKYGRGGRGGTFGKRKPLALACDVVLLCAVILVALTGFIWYASPTVEVGGVTYKAGAQNLYSFLFGADNSVVNQLKAAYESVENISSDAADGIGSTMKMLRLMFIVGVTLYMIIDTLIRLIQAPIYFAKKNGVKLRATATKAVINNIALYVFFAFFGSVSGGVGEDAYYMGYTVGTGKTVGVLLGLCMLVAAVVIRYIEKRKTAGEEERKQMRRSVVAGACYSAIAITVTFMRIYGVFMFVLTSTLTSIVGAFVGSFHIKVFLFPALNLLVFVSCNVIYNRAAKGFTGAFLYMLNYGDPSAFDTPSPSKAKKAAKAHALGFVPVIVVSALSVIAVFLLNIPAIGFGWSVDIYSHLIAIFAISACGQVCLGVVFGGDKREKKKAADAPKTDAPKNVVPDAPHA